MMLNKAQSMTCFTVNDLASSKVDYSRSTEVRLYGIDNTAKSAVLGFSVRSNCVEITASSKGFHASGRHLQLLGHLSLKIKDYERATEITTTIAFHPFHETKARSMMKKMRRKK